MEMFPDTDKEIIKDLYEQVGKQKGFIFLGRKKDMLIDAVLMIQSEGQ